MFGNLKRKWKYSRAQNGNLKLEIGTCRVMVFRHAPIFVLGII